MTPYEQAQQNLAKRVAMNGGGVSQASVGGINLQTGMPINSGGAAMPGAPTTLNGMPYDQGMAQQNSIVAANRGNVGAGGVSNSDAFFNSANSSTPGRVVSVTPNSASSGAAANTSMLNSLISSYKKASDQARTDQLAQHDALMKSVGGTTGTINSLLETLGKTGEQRISDNEATQTGRAEQDLISRGLGNSTIRTSTLRGVAKDAENSRQSLQEGLAQQKIGTQMQLGQMQGDAMLSRQNIAPGNEYLQLIQSLANRG